MVQLIEKATTSVSAPHQGNDIDLELVTGRCCAAAVVKAKVQYYYYYYYC